LSVNTVVAEFIIVVIRLFVSLFLFSSATIKCPAFSHSSSSHGHRNSVDVVVIIIIIVVIIVVVAKVIGVYKLEELQIIPLHKFQARNVRHHATAKFQHWVNFEKGRKKMLANDERPME
jgi:hypothetical protein